VASRYLGIGLDVAIKRVHKHKVELTCLQFFNRLLPIRGNLDVMGMLIDPPVPSPATWNVSKDCLLGKFKL